MEFYLFVPRVFQHLFWSLVLERNFLSLLLSFFLLFLFLPSEGVSVGSRALSFRNNCSGVVGGRENAFSVKNKRDLVQITVDFFFPPQRVWVIHENCQFMGIAHWWKSYTAKVKKITGGLFYNHTANMWSGKFGMWLSKLQDCYFRCGKNELCLKYRAKWKVLSVLAASQKRVSLNFQVHTEAFPKDWPCFGIYNMDLN